MPDTAALDNADAMLIYQLKQAMSETVSEFMAHPVDFLYESDIQSLLFAQLRKEMREIRYRSEAKDIERLFKSVPNINPVKTEYPPNLGGSRARFDVAVLSEKQDTSFKVWNQFCRIAIEIKLWQPDGTGALPFDDVKKLRSYRKNCNDNGRPFTGIAMLFVHPGAEQRVKCISGIESDVSFPYDDVAFHVVDSSRWYELRKGEHEGMADWSRNDKFCGTCAFWGGNRSFDCHSTVTLDPGCFGPCTNDRTTYSQASQPKQAIERGCELFELHPSLQ